MTRQQDVIGLDEIAAMLGVTRRSVYRYAAREDFPQPVIRLGQSRGWTRAAVEEWARDHLPLPIGQRGHRRPRADD
jgi:predicted DNA-binding transcriptional regulator AlpA